MTFSALDRNPLKELREQCVESRPSFMHRVTRRLLRAEVITVGNRPTAQPEICVTIFLPVLNGSKEEKMSENRLKCSNFGLSFSILGKNLKSDAIFFENKCSKIFVSVTIFKKCSAQNAL